jgi:hypothetical protein
MPKLTKRIVDAAEVRAADYFIWDDDVPGFGLRVFPSGRKGYMVQFRAGRRSRRMSLSSPAPATRRKRSKTWSRAALLDGPNGRRRDHSMVSVGLGAGAG